MAEPPLASHAEDTKKVKQENMHNASKKAPKPQTHNQSTPSPCCQHRLIPSSRRLRCTQRIPHHTHTEHIYLHYSTNNNDVKGRTRNGRSLRGSGSRCTLFRRSSCSIGSPSATTWRLSRLFSSSSTAQVRRMTVRPCGKTLQCVAS